MSLSCLHVSKVVVSHNCVTWKRGLCTSLVCNTALIYRGGGGCLYIFSPSVQPGIHRYTQCYTSVILCAIQVLALLYTSTYSIPIDSVTLKCTCV